MLKQIDVNVVSSYVAYSDRESEKPTRVYFHPMTKKDYDEYTDSLAEFKRGKLITHGKKSGEVVFNKCLATNPDGYYIENVNIDGKDSPGIKDKATAVNFLLNLRSEEANEFEQAMRGQSSLDEDESKN